MTCAHVLLALGAPILVAFLLRAGLCLWIAVQFEKDARARQNGEERL